MYIDECGSLRQGVVPKNDSADPTPIPQAGQAPNQEPAAKFYNLITSAGQLVKVINDLHELGESIGIKYQEEEFPKDPQKCEHNTLLSTLNYLPDTINKNVAFILELIKEIKSELN